jgi:dynactin-4
MLLLVRTLSVIPLLIGLCRCTRSCFGCPICTAPLSISSMEGQSEGLGADYLAQAGPYVLNCAYCNWSSKEIGIQLEKPNSVFAQLSRIKNGGETVLLPKERRREREEGRRDMSLLLTEDGQEHESGLDPIEKLDVENNFANLRSFYQSQLADSSPSGALGFSTDYGYGSPGALSRIMGLYTGGSISDNKAAGKKGAMREAQDALEGLQVFSSSAEERIAKLRNEGWHGTASAAQQKEQINHAQFITDLRPVASLLRTKRSKRCRTCRHILSKPESKVQNTRFRIRLVALNYIPSITIKPLKPTTLSPLLVPMNPTQYLLTFRNPLFDSVRVNIATPPKTPGRFSSKVTVLCPQFEVGANTDVWDEALREGGSKNGEREKRRTKAEASEGQNQAEAGKIWERGRNWVSVVVEVVPTSLKIEGPAFLRSEELQKDDGPLREDEDVLEIPVFVRLEWEAVAQDEGGRLAGSNKEKELKEKRELAYWCVLGVGKISRD